jgi:hypothetical protein
MRTLVLLSFLALNNGSVRAESFTPKYGPAGKPIATPLSQSPDFFKNSKNAAPDFWKLIPYYSAQFNGAACGVASLTMVLNAARSTHALEASDPLITQETLLDTVKVENWKSRIKGYLFGWVPLGARGTPLAVLGKISEEALKVYQLGPSRVTVRHFDTLSPESLNQLRKDLSENEGNTQNWIIANFNQKALTDDADVGHLAPVGAYDASTDRVLILDPDREWYEPYWVKTEDLARGMNTIDPEQKRFRGYLILSLGSQ